MGPSPFLALDCGSSGALPCLTGCSVPPNRPTQARNPCDFHPEVRGIVNEEGTSPPRPSAAPSLSTNQAYELVACQIPHLPDACLELCRGSTSPKIASKPTVYITLRVSLLLLTISSWCLASKQPSPIHSWPPESHLLTRLQGRNDRHSRTLP